MKRFLTVPALLGLLIACKVNPYRKTNRVYKDEARVLARQLEEYPLSEGVDSTPPSPYWVGTTNFNLRKPNFVIIHFTFIMNIIIFFHII